MRFKPYVLVTSRVLDRYLSGENSQYFPWGFVPKGDLHCYIVSRPEYKVSHAIVTGDYGFDLP